MYVRDFAVRNYLIHRDTKVRLDPLTVVVGPNGGGKSAFFDAMINFSLISRGNIRQAFGPYPYSYKATISRGSSPVSRIGYRASMSRFHGDDEWYDYEIDYSQQGMAEDRPTYAIFHEKLTRQPSGTVEFDRDNPDRFPISRIVPLESDRSIFAAIRVASLGQSPPTLDPLLAYCTERISRFNRFRLDPGVLAQPNRLPDVGSDGSQPSSPRIGYHGEDLAATLYQLSETQEATMELIKAKVREVDPSFQDFDFNTVGTDRIAFSAVYSDSRGAVTSVRLSAGVLAFVGLITLVATENRPPVMMIEEPENGLTPQAIKAFYNAVRSLAFNETPEARSQVLISSHSPFVICEAWNGEDRNFIHQIKVDDGQASVRRFQEVIDAHGIQLQKDESGQRTTLSLKNAELVMSGYMS